MAILENASNKIIISDGDGVKLYSYKTLIALYKNENLFLTSYYNYSKTTAKHLTQFINDFCYNQFNKKDIQPNTDEQTRTQYQYIIKSI